MQGDGIPLGDQGDQDKDDEARGEGGCDQDHCEAGGDEAARDQEVRGALGGRVGGGYIEHAHKEGMPNGGEGQGWAIPGFGQQYYTRYYTGQ